MKYKYAWNGNWLSIIKKENINRTSGTEKISATQTEPCKHNQNLNGKEELNSLKQILCQSPWTWETKRLRQKWFDNSFYSIRTLIERANTWVKYFIILFASIYANHVFSLRFLSFLRVSLWSMKHDNANLFLANAATKSLYFRERISKI